MNKPKIKRRNNIKKQITGAEKLMAGLGVGSTLLGMGGTVIPQGTSTNFVRSITSSATNAENVFNAALGVGTAKAAEIEEEIEEPSEQFKPQAPAP